MQCVYGNIWLPLGFAHSKGEFMVAGWDRVLLHHKKGQKNRSSIPWLGMGIAHNDEEEDLLGDGEKCF